MDAHLLENRGVLFLKAGGTILLIASQASGNAAALAEEGSVLRHHLMALGPHVRQQLRLFHGVAQQRVPAARQDQVKGTISSTTTAHCCNFRLG